MGSSDKLQAVGDVTALAEERIRALFSASTDGLVLADEHGRVERLSPSAEVMTGWSEREAAGRPLAEIVRAVHEATREPWADPAAHALRTGQVTSSGGRVMLVARGGDEHAIGATAAPIVKPDGSVAGVALVLHDDEEVRRADEATELLGGLAASLAHEVNNPLSSVVGSLEFLAHALEAGDLVALPEHDAEVGDAVRTARAGADRIRRLVREMKGGQTFEASLAPSASSRVRRGTTAAPDAGASTDVDGLAIYASRPITGTVLRTTRVRAGSGAGRGSSPGPKDEAPSAATGAPGDAPATGASRSRVLIVDDDPLVGTSLRRVLSRDHDVIVDVSAKDALSRLRDGERFDVVLCDLMMPDMTGMDLHAELARIAPQMAGRMVFLTGGAYTAHAREFLAAVPNPRLQKPFDAQLLRAVVRDVVAGARHDAKEGA